MTLSEKQPTPKIATTHAPAGHLHLVETRHQGAPEHSTGRFRASFERTAAARQALAKKDLATLNLDVPRTVNIVLSALPGLRALHAAMVAEVPGKVLARFEDLGSYAEALSFAEVSYRAASRPAPVLEPLAARGFELRDQLRLDAQALTRRGIVDARILEKLKGGTGFQDLAFDLGALSLLLRERWIDIQGKTAIALDELDEASAIFEQITRAYAVRKEMPASIAKAKGDRQRAYTVLLNAYDQARRAVAFFRWEEDDVERYVPSLWSGRGKRRAKRSASNDGTRP